MDNNKQEYVAKLEKAISQKYGEETINNPQRFWDEDKEKDYLEQSVAERQKFSKISESEDILEQDGFLINKKLLNRDHNRTCPVCEKYSFHPRDDLYMSKFTACWNCYIQYISDREARWATGWRPKKEKADE